MKSVHSISLKIWLPILFLSTFCILTVGMTWQSYYLGKLNIIQTSISSIKRDLFNLQREIERALIKGFVVQVDMALSDRRTNNNYQILVVADNQNRILHATKPSLINQPINELSVFDQTVANRVKLKGQHSISVSTNEEYITAYFPVIMKHRQFETVTTKNGVLFLKYDLSSRKNLAWQHVKNSVFPYAFILLFAMSVLLMFIKRYILIPFEYITQVTRNFSIDLPISNLHIDGHGEFAKLSAVLNKINIKRRLFEHKLQQSSKSAEMALYKLAEQKYALDQHSIVDVTDVSGTITYANDKFCLISGYHRNELIGENHRILNSHFHPKSFFRNMYDILSEGFVWHGAICNRSKKGNIYWVDTTIVPFIQDRKDKPQSYIAIRTDITKQRQAQQKLAESEERFELAMSVANDGIWDWDLKTNCMIFDDRYYTLAGYRAEEFAPELTEWEKRVHPDDIVRSKEILNQYLEGKRLNYKVEFRFLKKDGTYMWLCCKGQFVAYDNKGNPTRMVGTHSDINERKKAEIDLKENKDKLASLVNQIPYGIQEFDTRGKITFGNPAYCKIMGGELEDFIGRYYWEFEVDEALCNQLKKSLTDILKDQPTPEAYVTNRKRMDDQIITIDVVWNYQKNSQGEITGFITIISDITQQHKAQRALQRAQKMEAIGQLTGGIAHDFNNILGVIIGNLDLLNHQFNDNSKARKRIASASRAASRAENLTRKLLGFSGNKVTESKASNVNHLIKNMDDVVRHTLSHSINISFKFKSDLWLTDIDPGDLQDAILNLVKNAQDAMHKKEQGLLTIMTANTQLDETFCLANEGASPGEYVLLSISDNGVGIAKEHLSNIFEPFFTTKIQGKGTGLGLAMVFGFVKRSKGYIQVNMGAEGGTTFSLFLPRSKRVIKAEPALAHTLWLDDVAAFNLEGSESILVVDDEPGLLELAQASLCSLGYQVQTATNGIQALEHLAMHPNIDLVFSDIVMSGGISGYQLAEKTSANYPAVRILLTSGYTGKAEANNNHSSNRQFKLLKKPYTQKQLAISVRKLLGEKHNDTVLNHLTIEQSEEQ